MAQIDLAQVRGERAAASYQHGVRLRDVATAAGQTQCATHGAAAQRHGARARQGQGAAGGDRAYDQGVVIGDADRAAKRCQRGFEIIACPVRPGDAGVDAGKVQIDAASARFEAGGARDGERPALADRAIATDDGQDAAHGAGAEVQRAGSGQGQAAADLDLDLDQAIGFAQVAVTLGRLQGQAVGRNDQRCGGTAHALASAQVHLGCRYRVSRLRQDLPAGRAHRHRLAGVDRHASSQDQVRVADGAVEHQVHAGDIDRAETAATGVHLGLQALR